MCDFEVAAVTAFGMVFPRTTLTGCFFHLSQSIWRKVQTIGLTTQYLNDENTRFLVKALAALAYCSLESVPEAFEELRELATENEGLDELFDY